MFDRPPEPKAFAEITEVWEDSGKNTAIVSTSTGAFSGRKLPVFLRPIENFLLRIYSSCLEVLDKIAQLFGVGWIAPIQPV